MRYKDASAPVDGLESAWLVMYPMKLLIIAITLALFLRSGPTYLDETCSQFVCRRTNQPELKAQELWDGGEGQLQVVQAQAQFEDVIVEHLLEGDVIAFHGVHVAVYTHGGFMDSTPEHGEGRLQYRSGDKWYAGPVRVLRWKNKGESRLSSTVSRLQLFPIATTGDSGEPV